MTFREWCRKNRWVPGYDIAAMDDPMNGLLFHFRQVMELKEREYQLAHSAAVFVKMKAAAMHLTIEGESLTEARKWQADLIEHLKERNAVDKWLGLHALTAAICWLKVVGDIVTTEAVTGPECLPMDDGMLKSIRQA